MRRLFVTMAAAVLLPACGGWGWAADVEVSSGDVKGTVEAILMAMEDSIARRGAGTAVYVQKHVGSSEADMYGQNVFFGRFKIDGERSRTEHCHYDEESDTTDNKAYSINVDTGERYYAYFIPRPHLQVWPDTHPVRHTPGNDFRPETLMDIFRFPEYTQNLVDEHPAEIVADEQGRLRLTVTLDAELGFWVSYVFDPDQGYMPLECRWEGGAGYADGILRLEGTTVAKYRKAGDKWFPEKVETRRKETRPDGTWGGSHRVVEIRSFDPEAPLDDYDFTFESLGVEKGAPVYDPLTRTFTTYGKVPIPEEELQKLLADMETLDLDPTLQAGDMGGEEVLPTPTASPTASSPASVESETGFPMSAAIAVVVLLCVVGLFLLLRWKRSPDR